MINKTIQGWIRQVRYRAKKYDIINTFSAEDAKQLFELYNNICAYCSNQADSLDHLFSIKNGIPNTAANIVPACRCCKDIKKNNDLIWMFSNGKISNETYINILSKNLGLDGGEHIKSYMKKITGL